MATILAVDTSATPVSCAVVRDGRVIASYYSHTGLTHSQTLMPMVEHVLKVSGLQIAELDGLAVSAGPGSFTGVRIGVSAVKGMAFTHNLPCVSVSTLEAMAEALRGLPFDGVICCAMDARCRQVYTALFAQGDDGTQCRLTDDEAMSVDDLKNLLKKCEKSVIFVGDGADLCYNILKDEIDDCHLAPITVRHQSAVGVALAAQRKMDAGDTVESERLLPSYLRLPQAERELKARLQNS